MGTHPIINDSFLKEGDILAPKVIFENIPTVQGESFQFCLNNQTITFEISETVNNPKLVKNFKKSTSNTYKKDINLYM